MAIMGQGLDEDLAQAFYELLARAPVHVAMKGEAEGGPALVKGPSGEAAVPIFLDEAAFSRWAGASPPAVLSAPCSIARAAELALAVPGAMLVVDLGSSPGGQPIARSGVELLARGSHPYADRHRSERAALAKLATAIRAGHLDAALRSELETTRVFTIGYLQADKEVAPNVRPVDRLYLLGVPGPDGATYCAVWPTVAGTFAFKPDADRRLRVPLSDVIDAAIKGGLGLVIDPADVRVALSPRAVTDWWGAAPSADAGALPPWLEIGLGGAWVISQVDADSFDAIVKVAAANYRGPDFGGLDLMPPNTASEAWIFLGRWTDSLRPEIQAAARELDRCLRSAAELVRAGVLAQGGGRVELRVPSSSGQAEVRALELYYGVVPGTEHPIDAAELARLRDQVFPSMPRWIGFHMGMPHWLGVGMHKDGASIRGFTPYARLRHVQGHGIEIAALGERAEVRAWLQALRRGTRWF